MGITKRFGLAVALSILAAAATTRAGAQDVANGERLYQLCTQCHGEAGAGNPQALAPSIAGLPTWYVENQLRGFRAGYRGTHYDDVSGMRMRPMAISLAGDAELKDVAAYVGSLPRYNAPATLSGGDAARGQTLYGPCIACHGPEALGNPQLNAPPLAGVSDWYALTQLNHFKAGIRGTNQADAYGQLMRPMSMTLVDEQAMRDVIAYITTLAK
jgi:cytochrome c oxidase subunit II